jgi:hypothetical protein
VKKILSILVALGLVLGLVVMATPASANVTAATVTPVTNCAGTAATYTIGFSITGDLIIGTTTVTIDFPAGTDVSAITSITQNLVAVPAAWITVDTANAVVTYYSPQHLVAPAAVSVVIAGVTNPSPGTYTLTVKTSAPVDSTPVTSNPYTIVPALSTIDFQFDFSPTYPGLNPGFVPPFKACGQNMTTTSHCATIGGFLEPFDLSLITTIPGCIAPCSNATMWFVVEECPANEVITLVWDSGAASYTLTAADKGDVQPLPNVLLPSPTPPVIATWNNQIHFSSPGDYEICWYLRCPAVPCESGAQIIADECLEATVYQWKEWFQIDLLPKWNLISIPLFPFNTDITYILSALNASDQFMSVWYFDQCEDADPDEGVWHVYPGDLTTMEAGKAYWIRMKHPGDVGYNVSQFPAGLFVWGNHAPMPPSDPMASFDVCEGWNMVGFKAPWTGTPLAATPEMDDDYLWNFNTAVIDTVHYGLLYDYDEASQDWTYWLPGTCNMQPGVGYWIPFDGDGEIYPKP